MIEKYLIIRTNYGFVSEYNTDEFLYKVTDDINDAALLPYNISYDEYCQLYNALLKQGFDDIIFEVFFDDRMMKIDGRF